MKIHEYQAKEILRAAGVPVPRSLVARTADEAAAAFAELGGDARLEERAEVGEERVVLLGVLLGPLGEHRQHFARQNRLDFTELVRTGRSKNKGFHLKSTYRKINFGELKSLFKRLHRWRFWRVHRHARFPPHRHAPKPCGRSLP